MRDRPESTPPGGADRQMDAAGEIHSVGAVVNFDQFGKHIGHATRSATLRMESERKHRGILHLGHSYLDPSGWTYFLSVCSFTHRDKYLNYFANLDDRPILWEISVK